MAPITARCTWSHLLRVHGGCAQRVDDHGVQAGVGVDQVASVALPQGVHDAGLVEVEQGRQVFSPVVGRRVGLGTNMTVRASSSTLYEYL